MLAALQGGGWAAGDRQAGGAAPAGERRLNPPAAAPTSSFSTIHAPRCFCETAALTEHWSPMLPAHAPPASADAAAFHDPWRRLGGCRRAR
jgi:hypothetical protein